MDNEKQRSSLHSVWLDKYAIALSSMSSARKNGKGILIEIAAQHPLKDGKYPDKEFQARLDLGLRLYGELSAEENVKLYVPGSRHQENGKTDLLSLSAAGKNYLLSKGIPEEDIYADDANCEFMGDKGVYNSTDECYVACQLFAKHNYRELHLVCSPAQMMRKMLCYIGFGYFPAVHTAPCDEMYHNPIHEIFECIPKVLENNQKDEDEIRNARRV